MYNKTLFFITALCSYLFMGAAGCDATPPDVVGLWQTSCDFTNPVGHTDYYWELSATPEGAPAFKSWEKLANGSIKTVESFYIYQQNVVTVKNNEEANNDKLYYVTSKDANTLEFRGGEYVCTLVRATSNPYDGTSTSPTPWPEPSATPSATPAASATPHIPFPTPPH